MADCPREGVRDGVRDVRDPQPGGVRLRPGAGGAEDGDAAAHARREERHLRKRHTSQSSLTGTESRSGVACCSNEYIFRNIEATRLGVDVVNAVEHHRRVPPEQLLLRRLRGRHSSRDRG